MEIINECMAMSPFYEKQNQKRDSHPLLNRSKEEGRTESKGLTSLSKPKTSTSKIRRPKDDPSTSRKNCRRDLTLKRIDGPLLYPKQI